MAKRGRPTKKAKPGTKASLGLRVTANVKDRLEHAAKLSGRTQSQEAEYRIERSFDRADLLPELLQAAYGDQCAGMLLLFGDILREATASADFLGNNTEWPNGRLQNSYTFEVAEKAVAELFGRLASKTTANHDLADMIKEGMRQLGWPDPAKRIAEQALKRAMIDTDRAKQIRSLLGPLAPSRGVQ